MVAIAQSGKRSSRLEAALNRCLAILLNRNGTIRKEACISAVIFHIEAVQSRLLYKKGIAVLLRRGSFRINENAILKLAKFEDALIVCNQLNCYNISNLKIKPIFRFRMQ